MGCLCWGEIIEVTWSGGFRLGASVGVISMEGSDRGSFGGENLSEYISRSDFDGVILLRRF